MMPVSVRGVATDLMAPVHLDSYITCYPSARGSLIAMIMEAVRTSETSVNIYLTTRQYIPEDSKFRVANISV
jgi:hypothetical protein